MSSLSKKGFDAAKCKTLLQLTLQRIKILRNKRTIIAKQSRDDVAKLLEKGQDDSAKVRVEHVFREENIVAAYDLLEQYCQLIIKSIATIKSQQVCPSDLKEAIASLIYAAPRCGDLQELQKVRELFTAKYGPEFSVTALDLQPDCGVDTQIIKKLSSLPPNSDARLKLLKEIAAERKIDWNYQKAVAASFKSKGDLLDGPKNFVSANQVSKVDTPTASDKQKLVSISMHGDGSSSAHIAVPSPAASLKAKMSSLDRSPHSVHSVANHEIDTNTESKAAEHAVRAQKASSETITDGRKEDHKSPGNSGVRLKPDRGTPSSKLDPYALAKEEGRMDYKNVTESIRQAQEPDKILKGVEQERNTSAYDKYGRQPTGVVQDRKVSKDAPKHEDISSSQRSKEKGEGSNTISPHTRHQTKESTSKIQKDQSTLQELSEGNSTRHTSIVPPELARERGKAEPEFDDLETAAEEAFASAARAAEAAKAAIDMVRTNSIGRPIRKMVNANSLQRGHYLNSSFGSGKRENHKVTEGTSEGIDSEHSFERENLRGNSGKVESGLNQGHVNLYNNVMQSIVHHQVPGPRSRSSLDVIEDAFKNVESEKTSSSQEYIHLREKSGKFESGLNQGHVNLYNNVMHSIVHHQVPGPRARSSSDMIEDAFKNVESEKTPSSQKYIQTSTQAEMLNSKAEVCDFSQVRDEATQSLRNDPNRLGTCDLEHEEPSGSGSSEAVIKTSTRRFAEPYSEGVKKHETSFTRKQESSFDHTQLYQEEKRVLYDSQMPQFDAYSSDDSGEEEPPFYTKGRAAMAREDYGQVAEKASFNKPKRSMPQLDAEEEPPFYTKGRAAMAREAEKASFNKPKTNRHNHHSNLEINSIQSDVQEHSQKPQFDDYAESVDLSTWSTKSPVKTHASDMTTGIRSDSLVTSPMVDNDSYHKPTTCRKLRWQASTSEESDFYSQSDEVSPTLMSVKMPSQWQGQSGYGYRDLPTQANRANHRKLSWQHSVSEELDFPSKPSLEAGKQRVNFTTSKEFNTQPSLEVSKLKPSSRNEDVPRPFKQGRNPGSTTEVTQASTGKPYSGLSRRSVQSTRPKSKQDVLPPTSSYESTNSLSIDDENKYIYR